MEYALLATKNATQLINSVVNLLEDYKLVAVLVGSVFLFLILFLTLRR